jgi:rfaE bifunctional protein nucleotidyltransferase chain/domain
MKQMAQSLDPSELATWGDAQRLRGLRIGFTCGAFDLLHAGHVDYLERARALCDVLLVAVNSDDSIHRYKSPLRPIHPQDQRMRVIGALACVDAVTVLDHPRPLPLIEALKPHFYIKGGDYAASNLRSASVLAAWGGEARVIKVEFDSSTTSTIERAALLAAHAEPDKVAVKTRGLVLLDRDGTLVRSVPFLHEPARVALVDGAVEALLALQALGLRLAVVTNQQGLGLGYFTYDEFIATNQAMLKQLGTHGVKIAKIYFCPHSLADECACRKPGTRLLERALADASATADRAFVIGDSSADTQAAEALGIPSFRIDENEPETWARAVGAIADRVAGWPR